MSKKYPVVIRKGVNNYIAYIPDFNINTQGKNLEEVIYMAKDAIEITGIDMEDGGECLPIGTKAESLKVNKEEILAMVEVDFDSYRNCIIKSGF